LNTLTYPTQTHTHTHTADSSCPSVKVVWETLCWTLA